MGKYRSRLSFLTAIGIISIFSTVRFVGAATDCMDLNPPLADKPYACFQTPGGYIFETAESAAARLGPGATIPCLDPITKTNVSVNDFPHKMQAVWNGTLSDVNLWCYQASAPTALKGVTQSSMSQLSTQVSLPYFFPLSLIKMDSSGQVFTYTPANGCSGDTTSGFETGDAEACGLKWTYKLNPGSGPQRFSYMTKITPETERLGKGPVVMAPKVGNSLEPGLILGPDISSALGTTGLPHSVCQKIFGVPYYFTKDDFGCTESVHACHPDNPQCDNPGTVFSSADLPADPASRDINTCYLLKQSPLRMTLKNLTTGGYITPTSTDPTKPGLALKEWGFVGGNNACREGIITGIGSCSVIIGYQGGMPIIDIRYRSPDCPIPAAPASLAKSAQGTNRVTLRWADNSTDEDYFRVYRGTNTSTATGGCTCSFPTPAQTNTKSTTTITGKGTIYTHTWTTPSLANNGKYCFKVTANLRDGGESLPSNTLCVTCTSAGLCN